MDAVTCHVDIKRSPALFQVSEVHYLRLKIKFLTFTLSSLNNTLIIQNFSDKNPKYD